MSKKKEGWLSVKKRREIEEKARNHDRLKYFVHTYHNNGLYELFKRWIFPGPIGFLIRSLLVILSFLIHFLVQRCIFIGYKNYDKPAGFRRKLSRWCIRSLARLISFFAGFQWIEFVDHSKNRPISKIAEDLPRYEWDQPWPNISTHGSAFDIVSVGCLLGAPSFAAKDETTKIPMVSFLLKAYRAIIVYRDNAPTEGGNAHPSTFQTMQMRISNPEEGDYAPLVFAEGTTNNGACVLRFHTGAFQAGKPVRPIVNYYPHKHKSVNWESNPFLEEMYDMFTQFHNRLIVEILDLYVPSAAERADPQLYADNVGTLIANRIGVPYVTTVGLPEKLVMLALLQGRLQWEEVEGEMQRIDAEREAKAKKKRRGGEREGGEGKSKEEEDRKSVV